MSLLPTEINLTTFRTLLSQYPASVPSSLRDLDETRYQTLPSLLASRQKEGNAYLNKTEVLQLVEWKLRHGTFRPTLLKLVQENGTSNLETATQLAYSRLTEQNNIIVPGPSGALQALTSLRGIGPATASLILSVHSPDEVPFFSDELFRWCMWAEAEVKGKGGGWERKIGYTLKEYLGVVKRVREMKERLGVQAVEMEKVAWVLGRRGLDVGKSSAEGVVGEGEAEDGEGKALKNTEPSKQVARSNHGAKKNTEQLRKSTKRKASEEEATGAKEDDDTSYPSRRRPRVSKSESYAGMNERKDSSPSEVVRLDGKADIGGRESPPPLRRSSRRK